MQLQVDNGVIKVTVGTNRLSPLLQTTDTWYPMQAIMQHIGYDTCTNCFGRIVPTHAEVAGHDLDGFECLECLMAVARVQGPLDMVYYFDNVQTRGLFCQYVCSRSINLNPGTTIFPQWAKKDKWVGVRWNPDLYTSLCPLGLVALKFAFTDLSVHNKVGQYMHLVRPISQQQYMEGAIMDSHWLVWDTSRVQVVSPDEDYGHLRRLVLDREYKLYKRSLAVGMLAHTELWTRQQGDDNSSSPGAKNDFIHVLKRQGISLKPPGPDPKWEGIVTSTLGAFGDVKRLLK